ncbi:RmlC-like cupin domain-containing protein [Mycena epipterygia]|nr:RmlC-like cupin domain-containing protein [Mycena epipterygia]
MLDTTRQVAKDAITFAQFNPFNEEEFASAEDSEGINILPITGQGAIAVRVKAAAAIKMVVSTENKYLVLYITTDSCDLNLPEACQNLYHNVGGPNIVLDTEDFPEFSQAIQRSVSTKGCIGYTLLEGKASEFGFNGTYLRITLGLSEGNSPGVPYVLEIWPAGHHSPIHDHGDAFAVIKVLHGYIECTYFDALEEGKQPTQLGAKATLRKGAITWLGENNYQCYQYGDTNNEHHRYFRYVGQESEIHKFEPNSDMPFTEFRNAIKKEWDERPQIS